MIRPVGIRDSGDSGHLGTEYPLREILVGIPDSGDSGQWVFRIVGIPGGNHLRGSIELSVISNRTFLSAQDSPKITLLYIDTLP